MTKLEQTGRVVVTTARPARSSGHRRISGTRAAWFAITPAVLALAITLAYPVIDGIVLSFSKWSGAGPSEFIGLDNYVRAFTDPVALNAIALTLGYAFGSAILIVAVASLLAAAISGGARGAAFYRVVWFLPAVAPVTAAAVFWSTAFQPGPGFVNAILGWFGLGQDSALLADPNTAIYPIIFVTVWVSVGFAFLLTLGAMEQIPVSVYEAAAVDGAGRVRQFFSLTLPLIRPVLVVVLMFEIIWCANGFAILWAMTQGGPGYATTTLPVAVYKQAIDFANYGYASALAVIGGVILLIVGLISLRLSRSGQEAAR